MRESVVKTGFAHFLFSLNKILHTIFIQEKAIFLQLAIALRFTLC